MNPHAVEVMIRPHTLEDCNQPHTSPRAIGSKESSDFEAMKSEDKPKGVFNKRMQHRPATKPASFLSGTHPRSALSTPAKPGQANHARVIACHTHIGKQNGNTKDME